MNFNEEMYHELKSLELGGKLVIITKEDKATPEEYAKFQRKMDAKSKENEIMLDKSVIYAKDSLLC